MVFEQLIYKEVFSKPRSSVDTQNAYLWEIFDGG